MNRALRVAQTFNGAAEFNVGGDYFKLMDAPYPVTVELLYQGSQVLYAQNAQAGFYQRARFDLVKLTNPTSQAVAFLASSGEGGSDRLAGEVSIIDGSKGRTIGGSSFFGNCPVGNLAANYSHAQLYNPVGSGKRAVVRQVIAAADVAGGILVVRYDTALATNTANGVNKYVGGALSTCQLRSERAGSVLASGNFAAFYGQANVTPPPVVAGDPWVLTPGTGLMVVHNQVNVGLQGNFEWYEEANV